MDDPSNGAARPPEDDQELLDFLLHAPVTLCWVDAHGRILWTNEAGSALFASGEETCRGQDIGSYFVEPAAAARVLSRLSQGETVTNVEASLRSRNGAVHRVLIGANGLFRDGRFVHSRWVIRDITALLEREQAERHRALDAGRLKDEFLALLSHELRTPLGAILVWLGLLRQSGSDPGETARALEIIERSARTLERIIEDLLHASRIAAGGLMLSPQIVDLHGVVQVAVDSASADAALKGLTLTWARRQLPVWAMGDPGRLQQAFSNLLSNAIKFTPAGGRVDVSLDAADGQARLRISDTGEGMSAAFLPFAFERFRQQDSTSTRTHHGLGLGLYVVRHVIGHHGGVVSAESPGPGRGSVFSVLLPLAPEPRETASLTRSDPSGTPDALQGGLSVLLVDDEADAREALRLILQQNGMTVTTAASAREARELLERLQPDVLLSDIAMPGEDGLSLIRRVRLLPFDRGGQIPAIALSAYAGVEDRRRALVAGFQRHMAKPVDPAELVGAIAALVRTPAPTNGKA